MTTLRVIGIVGRTTDPAGCRGSVGAGKDAVARALLSHVPGAVQVNLADPIKRIVADVFDWEPARVWGHGKSLPDLRYLSPEGQPLTSRLAQQRLGTEWGRELCGDVWMLYLRRVLGRLRSGKYGYDPQRGCFPLPDCDETWESHVPPLVVISDVRFASELRHLAELPAEGIPTETWLVTRSLPGYLPQPQHPSETELSDAPLALFEQVLHNNGTLQELQATVRRRYDEEAFRPPAELIPLLEED